MDKTEAIGKLDKAAELIDEAVRGLEEESDEAQPAVDLQEPEEEPEEPEREEGEGEGEGESVRDRIEGAAGSVKDKVPVPSVPALAGLGVMSALAGLALLKALRGGGDGDG